MKTINKTLLAVALVAGSSTAMAASFPDFTVKEDSYAAVANTFVADKITGNYVEVATFGAGTFDLSIKWQAGQFVANDGVDPVTTQLGAFGGGGYGMYALFQGSGTFTTSGAGVTNFTFVPGGSLALYIDDDNNTTFTEPGLGTDAWTTGLAADDVLIATGSVMSGSGLLDPSLGTCQGGGINCGSFGTTNTFALEQPVGSDFFIAPDPFFNVQFDSGQLNNFSLVGTQTINGSFDVTFGTTVPEPSSMAIMGLGLLGLGFTRRKKLAK